MTESLVPNEDTKFLRNNHGGLLVLCNDGNHVGMYPASLADILNCSLDKSKFIIDIISDIAENYGFDNVDIATSIIFALSYKIPDPPVGTKNTYLEDYFVLTDAPLINPEDVAEILNVTIEFAKSIYESFYQSINDDESLQAFLQHIEEYLATNHDGVIPKEFQKGSISLSATSSNKSQFSQKEILNILSQQAPAELRPESIIVPIKNEEFSDAVPNIKRENKNNNTYDANNFIESPHFEITCDAIQELLDISP